MSGRTRTSKAWLKRHVSDPFVKRAREEGMRSRAAYKLAEIAQRDRLLRRGMLVADLGAAPGGWSQLAAARVGPDGRVIAVDRAEMAPVAGVTFIQGDFTAVNTRMRIEQALAGRGLDLVLCDMAPNITGVALIDQARAFELAAAAAEFAAKHLKPGGNFLVKAFHGADFAGFDAGLRRAYERVVSRKPAASRGESREVYLLGLGLKAVPGRAESLPKAGDCS